MWYSILEVSERRYVKYLEVVQFTQRVEDWPREILSVYLPLVDRTNQEILTCASRGLDDSMLPASMTVCRMLFKFENLCG